MKELSSFQVSRAEDLLYFFLPNFSMSTLIHSMVINNEYENFNKFYDEIVRFFDEFIYKEDCMLKIVKMFIYIFFYKTKYPKTAIRDNYCVLLYDLNYFEDEDEFGIEIYEKVKKAQGYLQKVEENLWTYNEFSSLNF